MKIKFFLTICIATFLMTFALPVHAGEPESDTVTVRGLVISSWHGLIINDGVRDYLLLGVDDWEYEGMVCEAVGTLQVEDDMQAINVMAIQIIAHGYPDDDLVGDNSDVGSLWEPANNTM